MGALFYVFIKCSVLSFYMTEFVNCPWTCDNFFFVNYLLFFDLLLFTNKAKIILKLTSEAHQLSGESIQSFSAIFNSMHNTIPKF